MATIPRVVTYEEWLQAPAAESGREEVVKGEIQIMPPPHLPHAFIIQRLISLLVRRIDETKISIVGSDFGLMITQDPLTCRSPDVALFEQRSMTVRDGLVWSPPQLVVEVISQSETRRRKQEKLEDYARIGVPEAWLISPEGQTVEIRVLSEGKLIVREVVVEGELRPTQFPEVAIPVAEIWPTESE